MDTNLPFKPRKNVVINVWQISLSYCINVDRFSHLTCMFVNAGDCFDSLVDCLNLSPAKLCFNFIFISDVDLGNFISHLSGDALFFKSVTYVKTFFSQ